MLGTSAGPRHAVTRSAQERNAMLKALLGERFGPRTRTEVRQLPHYVLTLARSGATWGRRWHRPACLAELEERRRHSGPPSAAIPLLPAGSIEEMWVSLRPRCG